MKYIKRFFFRRAEFWCMAAVLLVMAALPDVSLAAQPCPAQRVFSSPEEVRQALIAAAKAKDNEAMRAIFGPVACELEPGDPVEQASEFKHFAQHVLEGALLVKEGGVPGSPLLSALKNGRFPCR